MTAETVDGGQSDIFSVSQITAEIKALLDGAFPAVWVEGEISNFTHHFASGHMYFTLKDEKAELRAAMFRGYNEHLKFPVENGMMVLANGDISVYEARGQGGFGYDPIFYLPSYGCTSAELVAEEKNKISHRGQALQAFIEQLKD